MKSIAVAGSMAQKPGRGGHTWVLLQYLLGFRKLGWNVLFLDRLEPEMSRDEGGAPVPIERSWNVRYLRDVMHRFGFGASYAVFCDGGQTTIGLSRSEILERVGASEALVNVMGFFNDREILAAAPRRIFLDIDPGFGQMWQASGLHETFRGHDAYVTIAENIGKPECTVPTCGLPWITTRQPVFMDEWPEVVRSDGTPSVITTVASWRGAYGPVTYEGATYGLRVHQFRKFATLPCLTSGRFELALDIHGADGKDVELLRGNGWRLVDPRVAAGDPWRYRDYIRSSAAEFMIAKGMYVQTCSGWFSDRSVCYLASGRPVLAQDTGLEGVLPIGAGLLTFATLDEAAAAAEALRIDYARHARAARALAAECFDSSAVLTALSRKLNLCA
jgi:hypothetical protein